MQYFPIYAEFNQGLETARRNSSAPDAPSSPYWNEPKSATATLRQGGPALLFENPTVMNMPVNRQTCSGHRANRVAMGMGAEEVSELCARSANCWLFLKGTLIRRRV